MQLPSDLEALDEDVDQHSTQWRLWRSGASSRFYALVYDPHPGRMEWYGFRLRAKSSARERLELSEYWMSLTHSFRAGGALTAPAALMPAMKSPRGRHVGTAHRCMRLVSQKLFKEQPLWFACTG